MSTQLKNIIYVFRNKLINYDCNIFNAINGFFYKGIY